MYSKYPKNTIYKNTGKDRDFNVYTEEFLGGADTYIYINGELYKDISAIQYNIREQQKPIYGYGSRLFDDVATGVRIIQGLIKVPVRNSNESESLTFVPTFESAGTTLSLDTPDWLYNFRPNNKTESSNNVQTPLSMINDVQSKLIDKGYNVEQTGILDSKTKIAILKYKKTIGDNINLNNIDNILKGGE